MPRQPAPIFGKSIIRAQAVDNVWVHTPNSPILDKPDQKDRLKLLHWRLPSAENVEFTNFTRYRIGEGMIGEPFRRNESFPLRE